MEGIMPAPRPSSAAAPRPAMLIPVLRPPDIAVAAPRLPLAGLTTAAAASPGRAFRDGGAIGGIGSAAARPALPPIIRIAEPRPRRFRRWPSRHLSSPRPARRLALPPSRQPLPSRPRQRCLSAYQATAATAAVTIASATI
jgi:hypothetical protein